MTRIYEDPTFTNSAWHCIGHDDRAWHVAWNPTRPILASCSADKTVRLYNYHSSRSPDGVLAHDSLTFSHNTTIPTGHAKTVRTIAWAPSGKTLATASFDSNIGVWAQEDDDDGGETKAEWECMSLLEGHETECKSVAYSASGNLLASCSRDKTVWVWEGTHLRYLYLRCLALTRFTQYIPILILNAWAFSWNIHKTSSALRGIPQRRSATRRLHLRASP